MFLDELTQIKNSENQAEELRIQSKLDCKKLLDHAKSCANELLIEAETDAKGQYDSLLQEGENLAEQKYRQYISNTEDECKKLISKARTREEEVVNTIVERIVRTSVNN